MTNDQRLAQLKGLLTPVEWEYLKDWHKNAQLWCDQTDDFIGARMHRDRFREMDGYDKKVRDALSALDRLGEKS